MTPTARKPLRCLLTASPIREHLDPVRFLSNGSSGKMGYALAANAATRGWTVDLVSSLPPRRDDVGETPRRAFERRAGNIRKPPLTVTPNEMKKKPSRELLRRSCAWIRDHWDARNLDVPPDLLREWTYQSEGDDLEPSGFHLSVFTFGVFQHDQISNHVPTGVQRSFSTSLIVERFNRWQMKLALAEIHRHTDIRVRPLPLFAFPEDEKIDFSQAAPDQTSR